MKVRSSYCSASRIQSFISPESRALILVGREVSGLAEQLLQALLAELFVLGVVRLGDAVGEGEKSP